MVGIATIATVLVAGLASLFMAWAIGAGSSGSTPFAPAVGANAISIMRAGFVVGLLGLGGAVIQGANVSEAVGRELIVGDPLSAQAAALALTIAAALVAIGIFAGYPIATAFTVTGAVVGVGLAMGGDPAWPKYVEIATLWVLVPFVGGGIAYATARFLRSEGTAERLALPTLAAVVGALIANVEIALLGEDGASIAATTGIALADAAAVAPIAGHLLATAGIAIVFAAALYREMRIDPAQGQRRFLLALGGLVAFSAGGSQVGLAIGPLLPLLDPYDVNLFAVLAGGGLGLLVGSWTGAPRMIKAIAQDYSSLGPRRSIAALIPSFAIAQAAVLFGIPVSFNEIIVSSIVGAGYASGEGVSAEKVGYTIFAWVASLALALGLGFGLYAGLAALFGA